MGNDLKIVAGVDCFDDFFKKSYYYIDKTRFIKPIFQESGLVTLFTRPRRFGKTINMTMLKSFLQLDYEELNDKLSNAHIDTKFNGVVEIYEHLTAKQETTFKSLDIYKEKEFCFKYMGQYPVLFLTFKDIVSEDAPLVSYKNLANKISNLFLGIPNLSKINGVSEDLKETYLHYKNFVNTFNYETDRSDLQNSLINIANMLYTYTHRKVVLIIDEYDVPIERASHEIAKYKEKLEEYKSGKSICEIGITVEEAIKKQQQFKDLKNDYSQFLSNALKGSSYCVEQATITGCLKIAKESIFTGLNNLKVYGVNDDYFAPFFGLTNSEVDNLLSDYNQDNNTKELKPLIKEWYDGYIFGKTEIYSLWDVINFVGDVVHRGEREPEDYWIRSSRNQLPQDVFRKNPTLYADDYQKLLKNQFIEVEKCSFLNYDLIDDDLISKDYFWNLMYSAGYLTTSLDKQASDDKHLLLKIPNKCVFNCLKDLLERCFKYSDKSYAQRISPLLTAFYSSDENKIANTLTELLTGYISFLDNPTTTPKEFYYHAFLNGIFSALGEGNSSILKNYNSNLELKDGRSDITFSLKVPQSQEMIGIVIELKLSKDADSLYDRSFDALKQIEDKGYAEGMLSKNKAVKQVKAFGIAFFNKDCYVLSKDYLRN